MAGKNTPAPTPAPVTAREPVTATGVALLAMIAAAGGTLMLTQAEGADIVSAGHATVDTTNTDGDTAAVTLTDAGREALEAGENDGDEDGDAVVVSGSFEIEDGVPMPTDATRRGRSGGYPFDKLAVNQSFHVPKTADNEDPATRLASSVSGARAKYSTPIEGETETVKVKEYQRNENGKGFAKDAEGKRIIISERDETRPKMKITRDFTVKSVGADDPKGEGARVWRTA